MAIKHTFASSKADGADTSLVRPSDWNADHTVEDGSLTIAKTSGLQDALDAKTTTASLFDYYVNLIGYDLVEADHFLNALGARTPNAGWGLTAFIPVLPDTVYYTSPRLVSSFFYDVDQVVISAVPGDWTALSFTTPANCVWVRMSLFRVETVDPHYMLSRDEGVANGAPAFYLAPAVHIEDTNLTHVGADKIDFLIKNLVTGADFTPDTTLNPSTGADANLAHYARTTYIPVTAGLNYFIDFFHIVAYYDAAKVSLAGSAVTEARVHGVYKVPAGAFFMRLVAVEYINAGRPLDDLMVVQSDVPMYVDSTNYDAFVPQGMVSGAKTVWFGKYLALDGDSIMAGGMISAPLATLGFGVISNYGVGGSTVTGATGMCSDARVAAINPLYCDALMLMGGSNDWAASAPLGTIDSAHDYTTFYGAYQLWLDKLYVAVPNARIFILEPSFRANMFANTESLVLDDYRAAARAVAHKYGYPTIETTRAGINQLNYTTYLSGTVHPNTAGGKRIAEVIIGVMKAHEPIA